MNGRGGFTLLEVMFSLLIFSAGMLAYVSYQSRASAMLFETESTAIATAIAVEAAEELNSMTEDDFRILIENINPQPTTGWLTDTEFKAYSSLFNFSVGPFDAFGRALNGAGNGMFTRLFRVTTFSNLTNTTYEENSPMEVLRVIEIYVGWPNRGIVTKVCDSGPGDVECNHLIVPVMKPIYYY